MDSPNNNIALTAFRNYCDTVLRTVYNIVHSYSEAEDITQEVFLKLHENPQNFESETHLKAWLLRSAINRAKNYHKSFRVKMVSPIDETNENCFAQDFTPEENELLEKVRNLPAKYSLVIYLYYYEGYKTITTVDADDFYYFYPVVKKNASLVIEKQAKELYDKAEDKKSKMS